MGAFKADYDRMAVPVTGDEEKDAKVAKQSLKRTTLYPDTRLFFAGEATHRRGGRGVSLGFGFWVMRIFWGFHLMSHYFLATKNHEPRTTNHQKLSNSLRRRCSPLFFNFVMPLSPPPIHREDAYTVHGAFLSGEREALNIAKWWRQYHDDM